VKANKVTAIESNYGSVPGNRKHKDLVVRLPLISLTRLLRRQHVVPQTPQMLNGRKTEVLVGVQSDRCLSILIILDCLINLFRMAMVVIPRRVQVRLGEAGMPFENLLIGQVEPLPLDQTGYRMPRVANARFAVTDPVSFLNPTSCVRVTI
jgi:hypothetical protein